MTAKLQQALARQRQIKVIGFDDAPFNLEKDVTANLSGIICSNTRFEGMLWGQITKDGWDVTEVIASMINQSKFHNQLHLILLDGISFAGFNVVDLPALHEATSLPCAAIMRRYPKLEEIDQVMRKLPDYKKRKQLLTRAGQIHQLDDFVFQAYGASEMIMTKALGRATDTGKVPEALRLAHLIGAAVMTGESSKRA